jgi:hypothetical protein
MTLLRAYFLPDTGEQLSCYIAPNGIIKLKVAGKGYDLIVGIGRNEEETVITDQNEHLVTSFSDIAGHFCDAVYQEHTQGFKAFDTLTSLMNGGELPTIDGGVRNKFPASLKDFTEGWVLPVG